VNIRQAYAFLCFLWDHQVSQVLLLLREVSLIRTVEVVEQERHVVLVLPGEVVEPYLIFVYFDFDLVTIYSRGNALERSCALLRLLL
jgi:hypothetical protein